MKVARQPGLATRRAIVAAVGGCAAAGVVLAIGASYADFAYLALTIGMTFQVAITVSAVAGLVR